MSNPDFDEDLYNRYLCRVGDSNYSNYFKDIRFKKTIKQITGKREILIPLRNENNKNIERFKYLHLIICLGLSGLSIYHFADMLTGFLNPSYGALKTITEVVKTLK